MRRDPCVGKLVRALCALAVGVTAVLAPAGAAVAGEPGAGQRLETFELPSPLADPSTPGGQLPDGRTVPKVNVLLPEGYDANPDRAYPVLWLLHGAGGGTGNWLPGIRTLAAGLPAVVVMPDGGLFGMYMNWWNDGARADPSWAGYHLNLFKDTIESRYRVLPERRWHAIAGISMGGQGALRYSALLPGYFGSVATFSAALPNMRAPEAQLGISLIGQVNGISGVSYQSIFGPPGGAYAEGNSPQALAENYGHTRMFLTSGNGVNCPQDPVNPGSILIDTTVEGFVNLQQGPFAAAVHTAGADVTAKTTCGVHTFGVWDRAFAAARAWGLFEPVDEHPRDWAHRTIATSGEMWGLDFRFAGPPSTVAEFTRTGGTLSATGSGQVELTGPGDCRITATLPFTRTLPTDCDR